MPRTAALLLLAFLALTATPAPADAKAKRSACQRLDAHHSDQSPHPRLVLVSRGDPDYGDIAACVLPRGPVRRLATWDDGLGRASGHIVATRGFSVLIEDAWADQYGGESQTLVRVHARTLARVTLASYSCFTEFGQLPCTDGTSYGQVALARTGAGAIELRHLATGAVTLEAFGRAGTLSRLDDGPVEDLRIEGGEIVWTRSGTERRAPLPA